MRKRFLTLLIMVGFALLSVPLLAADDDFTRFSRGMLESTQERLRVETIYRNCLADAGGKEDYFLCRDNRDKALQQGGQVVGQMLNPDSDFVWNDDVRVLYLGVTDRAIQGRKDTIFCLEQSSTMDQYEQCLAGRLTARQH